MSQLIKQQGVAPTRKVTMFTAAGTIAGFVMIILAVASPEIYERLRAYPGAEAHIATGIGLLAAYFTRDRVAG